MERDYQTWISSSLQRKMEFLWFGSAGRPVILFPTSAGRFYQHEDFGLVGSLADKIGGGEVQVICVDSVDEESWYNNSAHPADRVKRHEQYDRYIRHELVPYLHDRTQRDDLAVFGASFGAYHAANFAGRYPDVIRKAILFSGIYDIHRFVSGYWDERCYYHCPTAYIANMGAEWIARLSSVSWIIATGEWDSLVQDNRQFAGLLAAKGIPRHCEIWPGVFGHDWPLWRDNLRRFLP